MKDIKGFEGKYAVTEDGRIWRYFRGRGRKEDGHFLNSFMDKNGYLEARLSKGGRGNIYRTTVHRIVAEAFIPNPLNKLHVNHKNGIKNDNRVENLEWNTPQENIEHARVNGLMPSRERHGRAVLTEKDVELIRKIYIPNIYGYRRIAKLFRVHPQTIVKILKNISWHVEKTAVHENDGVLL